MSRKGETFEDVAADVPDLVRAVQSVLPHLSDAESCEVARDLAANLAEAVLLLEQATVAARSIMRRADRLVSRGE